MADNIKIIYKIRKNCKDKTLTSGRNSPIVQEKKCSRVKRGRRVKRFLSFLVAAALLAAAVFFIVEKKDLILEKKEQLFSHTEQVSGNSAGALYDIDEAAVFRQDQPILNGSIDRTVLEGCDRVCSLSVTLGGGTLKLQDSGDESFYYETKNADKLQLYAEDNVLYVKAIRTNGYQKEMEINLYVPAAFLYESVELHVGAGRLVCTGVECKEMTAAVEAGELILEKVKVREQATCSVGAGHLQAGAEISQKLQVECTAGGADLELTGAETDYDYRILCSAGKIRVGEKQYTALSETKEVSNDAGKQIELQCSLGSISVTFGESLP